MQGGCGEKLKRQRSGIQRSNVWATHGLGACLIHVATSTNLQTRRHYFNFTLSLIWPHLELVSRTSPIPFHSMDCFQYTGSQPNLEKSYSAWDPHLQKDHSYTYCLKMLKKLDSEFGIWRYKIVYDLNLFLPASCMWSVRPAGPRITLRFPHLLYVCICNCVSALIMCAIITSHTLYTLQYFVMQLVQMRGGNSTIFICYATYTDEGRNTRQYSCVV